MADPNKHVYRWGIDASGNDITEADSSMNYVSAARAPTWPR